MEPREAIGVPYSVLSGVKKFLVWELPDKTGVPFIAFAVGETIYPGGRDRALATMSTRILGGVYDFTDDKCTVCTIYPLEHLLNKRNTQDCGLDSPKNIIWVDATFGAMVELVEDLALYLYYWRAKGTPYVTFSEHEVNGKLYTYE